MAEKSVRRGCVGPPKRFLKSVESYEFVKRGAIIAPVPGQPHESEFKRSRGPRITLGVQTPFVMKFKGRANTQQNSLKAVGNGMRHIESMCALKFPFSTSPQILFRTYPTQYGGFAYMGGVWMSSTHEFDWVWAAHATAHEILHTWPKPRPSHVVPYVKNTHKKNKNCLMYPTGRRFACPAEAKWLQKKYGRPSVKFEPQQLQEIVSKILKSSGSTKQRAEKEFKWLREYWKGVPMAKLNDIGPLKI